MDNRTTIIKSNIYSPTPVLGIVTIGLSTPTSYFKNITWSAGTGNITDSYAILRNGTWFNTTNTFLNTTTNHGWINDTIYAVNTTGGTTLSSPLINNTPIAINITSWSNNFTNNQNLNFIGNYTFINFNITTDLADLTTWTVNGVDQSNPTYSFTYNFSINNTYHINSTVYNLTTNTYDYKNWTVTLLSFNISGYVKNITGVPVQFATVSCVPCHEPKQNITDSLGFYKLSGMNHSFNSLVTANISTVSNSMLVNAIGEITNLNFTLQELILISPTNLSSQTATTVNLTWEEYPSNNPLTYQLSTDSQFINIISSGSISSSGYLFSSGDIGGLTYTTYYWHVRDAIGSYSPTYQFNVTFANVPGQLNITVLDELTHQPISDYTINLYSTTSSLTKSTTNGYVNFSMTEVISGQYLVIAVPNSSYFQRMVLVNSPTNVTMYLPPTTNTTIDLVVFSLLDVSGIYPYTTSTITITKSGNIMDSSYFNIDGTHPVYLIQGDNYGIQIQNGDNIFSSNTYIPSATGTSTITINNFLPNLTQIQPFSYTIPYNVDQITLNWEDRNNVMNQLNFTVFRGTSPVQICQQITSVKMGQSVCNIDNTTIYNVVFSALMNDGTYQNSSFVIDYTGGNAQSQVKISPIDGSPIGIGFNIHYGSFQMPQNILNWISGILIILLSASFGARFSGLGAVFTGCVMFSLSYVGLFQPINTSILMGISVVLIILSLAYFIQHKERGG